MYSRNYGRSESSAKIMPPPAYSGSAIRGGEPHAAENEEARTGGAFAPFSQNITLPKSKEEEEKRPSCEPCEPPCEKFEPPPKKCEPPCE